MRGKLGNDEKRVLMAIKPEGCKKIFSGEKLIEIRKTRPKLEPPFRVYVYQTKYNNKSADSGAIVGEFTCHKITTARETGGKDLRKLGCITSEQLLKYTERFKGDLYAWHISEVEKYEIPLPLSIMKKLCPVDQCMDCQYSGMKPLLLRGRLYIDPCTNCLKRAPRSWCYVCKRCI